MRQSPILIFEDEPVIASHLLDELERHGHPILTASNADEALRLSERHHPAFAILNFRGKNWSEGALLARQLRSLDAEMKILFVTGARSRDFLEAEIWDAAPAILYKPFSRWQLRGAVERLLAMT